MKEVVERILREEEAARAKIEKAREEAEDIILRAKKGSRELIEERIRSAKDSAEKGREESERAFLSEKEKVLRETRDKSAALRKAREKDIPEIARRIFSRIMHIED